jgi:heat shock protein HtpX
VHNHHNGLKTAALFGVLWAVLLGLGAVIGVGTRSASPIWIMAVIGVATTAYGYWNSDKIAIRSMAAYPVSEAEAPQLYQIVRELSVRANQPMPRIYVSPTMTPNAFATGRNPHNAAVAATTGLLDALDRDEVAAVMAHELGHVRNRDTLVMTMVATIAGAISMIANFGLFFSNGENRPNPLAAIGAVILAPFAAMIVQMAISRTREFGADRAAAEISGDPRALARALAKIAGAAQRIPDPVSQRNPATAQLYIVPTSISEWFSTHPPTEKRIAALEALYTTTPAPGRVARRSALDPHSSDR